jgi:FADH2 O2-dependent halogenase
MSEPELDGPQLDADVIVIGGGPAGATVGAYLGRAGHRVMVLERDIHPREHVGESLVPATNIVTHDLGFWEKLESSQFVKKPGATWRPSTRCTSGTRASSARR